MVIGDDGEDWQLFGKRVKMRNFIVVVCGIVMYIYIVYSILFEAIKDSDIQKPQIKF